MRNQMKKKAFITGINGQDGSYLAEHLLEKDYDVYGIVRTNSFPEHHKTRVDHLNGKLYLEYASDMKLKRAMKKRDKKFKILQNDLALQQLENGT